MNLTPEQTIIGTVLLGVEITTAKTSTAKEQRTCLIAMCSTAFDLKKKKAAAMVGTVTDTLLRNGIIAENPLSKRLTLRHVEGPFLDALNGIKQGLSA